MRIALISFHKNISRYPTEWIEKYRESIINQTHKDFDIFELNYGNSEERIFENSEFISLNLNDHAQAHNYLIEKCFSLNYDMVLNTNVDDRYPLDRVKIQIDNFNPEISVMSGNYVSFSETRENIHCTKFHELDISKEFFNNHNIVAHPACAYTKKMLEYNEKLISEEIASDDFLYVEKAFIQRG